MIQAAAATSTMAVPTFLNCFPPERSIFDMANSSPAIPVRTPASPARPVPIFSESIPDRNIKATVRIPIAFAISISLVSSVLSVKEPRESFKFPKKSLIGVVSPLKNPPTPSFVRVSVMAFNPFAPEPKRFPRLNPPNIIVPFKRFERTDEISVFFSVSKIFPIPFPNDSRTL